MTGPIDGSRKAIIVFLPLDFKASPKPMVTVDLPSPAGVGLIAVTKINFPSDFFGDSATGKVIFALNLPYGSTFSGAIPASCAIFPIGNSLACCAISISCIRLPHLTNIVSLSVSTCLSTVVPLVEHLPFLVGRCIDV